MSWDTLFFTLLTPALVILIALVERRSGPTAAGLLQGTPVIAFPVMIFLALNKPEDYFQESALAAFGGLLPLQITLLMYGILGSVRRTSAVVVSAIGVWIASATLISLLVTPVAAVLSGAGFLPVWFTTQRVSRKRGLDGRSWETIPLGLLGRAATAFVVAAAISLLSSSLDGVWIGLLTAFPTSSAILLTFNHSGGGSGRVQSALAGINTTIPALALFLLCCPLLVHFFSTLATTLVSLVVSLTGTAIVGVVSRHTAGRRADRRG